MTSSQPHQQQQSPRGPRAPQQQQQQQIQQNQGGPTWSPSVVEDLIVRQFLKGEDVTNMIPLSIQDSNRNRLPEFDPSIRALQKYCEAGPSVPTNNSVNTNNNNNNNNNTNQFGGSSRSQTPMKNRPPLAGQSQQQQQQQQQNKNGPSSNSRSPTPGRNNNNNNQQQQNNNNNNSSPPSSPVSDPYKRRRVEWPSSVPTDNQLKGNSRTQLQPYTERRIQAQAQVDPDLIFSQDTSIEFPLTTIFARHPAALKLISQTRGLSGDWRKDTFSSDEELQYKKDMQFDPIGPSQCTRKGSQHFNLY